MSENLRKSSTRLTAFRGMVLMAAFFRCVAMGHTSPPPPDSTAPASLLRVNRTVPKVELRKSELQFSAKPAVQEIFRARIFEEPLVPIGGEPDEAENAALAAALLGYAKRTGPDDFASLTEFLEQHPNSPWCAALLTDIGLEYYNAAHFSLALEAWREAWANAKDAMDVKGKAIVDRAAGELAYMYARLGRMTELEALLKSVEGRTFVGAATEKIAGAREGLWNMQNKPEISFKCGPYALQRILLSDHKVLTSSPTNALMEIFNFPSTQMGCSLLQVAELSKKVGLNYQMAFRGAPLTPSLSTSDGKRVSAGRVRGDFIIPSVVHWKVGHYAAMVRQEGDRYLLEDPTFGNTVWATRQALEAETSGYFLIPPGNLPRGWRSVDVKEGASIWGKGQTASNNPGHTGCEDAKSGGSNPCGGPPCGPFGGPAGPNPGPGGPGPGNDDLGFFGNSLKGAVIGALNGMAVSSVHLMLVSLNIIDTPVGYSPPVGFPVQFTVRYSQRDAFQPANFTYSNFGPKWTCDWISYITDNPSNTLADVNYYAMGGGTRTFTGFTNSQTSAFQVHDQTLLKRTGESSYEMLAGDGSKAIFSQSDGSMGTSRKVFLTQLMDPFGNAVTLTYDATLRLVAITDAIGQVTTLTYGNTNDIYKITRVTDPFGRFANFEYDGLGRLTNITDVIGINSRFKYEGNGDFINALITPYGTNSFIKTPDGPAVARSLETVYSDGSRDRVEFNQTIAAIPQSEPASVVPAGMPAANSNLRYRNTFYWSRTACASSYGDYTKAKIYHWTHKDNLTTSAILESSKEALENRVWYNHSQISFNLEPTRSLPTHIGRVLDDGTTQLYLYDYDGFGHVTNSIDPVGRTFSYLYASNGIDLLEVRQTRAGNNELLFRAMYNAQHVPLATVGADGQTNTFTYNARGQLLTATNPKGETTIYTYDTNGYLIAVDGPLPGTNDMVTATYDELGRIRTKTDESGYTLMFEHDNLDRLTQITHPDSTFEQFHYNRLDLTNVVDRAGRQTLFEFDGMQQMKKRTDPIGRVTLFEWCRCGNIKSLTDPMGRTTSWLTDVQERPIAKQFGDGSKITYVYETTSSRVRQAIDEKQQITQYTYNRDNTLKSVAYANATVPTPAVSYTYDPNYRRVTAMTDGTGITLYSYNAVALTPTLGANQLAGVDGPLPNDTITYAYDELGRRISTAINGVASVMTYDAAGRIVGTTNALGSFAYFYDGSSGRLLSQSFPNGQTEARSYGNILQDLTLQRITHKVGATPVSEFLYGRDVRANRITNWSQQIGAQPPDLHTFGYDAADQLLSATVTNAGTLVKRFAYTYDSAGNRLAEQIGSSNYTATYNALNQISTTTAPGTSRTNEWDAMDRLVAVNAGNGRTEFTYDGQSRLSSARKLVNGSEVSFRRFVWCDNELCEERDTAGAVTKRFYPQGMKLETGPDTGNYFYARDHLGSIRELTDGAGSVQARYSYDPYGRRIRLTGDLDTDFSFAGMFFAAEAGLGVTRFRAYDSEAGRWLSRDPLPRAEMKEGPNLYSYVADNPINRVDQLGLSACCDTLEHLVEDLMKNPDCRQMKEQADNTCRDALKLHLPGGLGGSICGTQIYAEELVCKAHDRAVRIALDLYMRCLSLPCDQPPRCNWRQVLH
jgi:RHS repeat-associated protein